MQRFFISCLAACSALILSATPILGEHAETAVANINESDTAQRFIKLLNHSSGIMPNLSVQLKMNRIGAVEQSASISSCGTLCLTWRFFQKQKQPNAQAEECSIRKILFLKDFRNPNTLYYEIIPKMNCISVHKDGETLYLAFQSAADLELGKSLFKQLLRESAEHNCTPQKLASEILYEAGFRSVALLPRGDEVDTSIDFLCQPGTRRADRMVAWATKQVIDPAAPTNDGQKAAAQALLQEGMNLSPIFLYPLTLLDEAPFMTAPFIGADFLKFFTDAKERQSVSSSDVEQISALAQAADTLPIQIKTVKGPLNPSAIVCRSRDRRRVESHCPTIPVIPVNSLFFYENTPNGSSSGWVTGISAQSDDLARLLFFDSTIPSKKGIVNLFREFPNLEQLLSTQSQLRKHKTIGESLYFTAHHAACSASKLLKAYKYPEESIRRICWATAIGAEAGSLFGNFFGDKERCMISGVQFALSFDEKMNAPWQEIVSMQKILGSEFSGSGAAERASPLQRYLKEFAQAQAAGIPFTDWICIKSCMIETLSTIPSLQAAWISERAILKTLLSNHIFMAIDGSCLPHNRPKRPLFSGYFWEAKDQFHRDGLSLNRLRYSYESELLKQPKSRWYGQFWEWVHEKGQMGKSRMLPPTKYLSHVERSAHRLSCVQGRITAPTFCSGPGEDEYIFVLGPDEKIYLGKKVDAKNPGETSFNHASFFSGEPVLCAGKVIIRDGRIISMTDHSGHYRCGPENVAAALELFKAHGVSIEDMEVELKAPVLNIRNWQSGQTLLATLSEETQTVIAAAE